jgi:DNA polymerase III subunit delta'
VSWTHIQGHDRWIENFADVVRQNRLGHAYLFLGPPGIGKRLFARELGKTLLCENRGDTKLRSTETPTTTFAACDRCASCLLVDAGTHPDLFSLQRPEGKNELPVNLMRDLCRDFSLKSARGHGKIAIVDDADDLNDEAANCFLKTLEEPPPRSVIFLIGTSRDHQLPTILSRCQSIRFAPLPENTVAELLGKRDVPAELIPRLARLAEGSPGQALDLADPALWEFRRTLLTALAKPRADVVALAKVWSQFAEEAGKEAASQRRRAGLILRLVQAFLADALAVSIGGQPRMQDAADRILLRELCERASPEKIMALLERTLQTEKHLDRYVQVSLVLEALLVGGDW